MTLEEADPVSSGRSWSQRLAEGPWLLPILLAVAFVTFSSLLWAPFVFWDDYQIVVENPDLGAGQWQTILQYWDPRHPHLELYTPLTYSLYAVLGSISRAVAGPGLSPGLFHAANVVIHLCGGALLWLLLVRLVRNRLAATFGAAAFLLHPIQVEAAAWVSSLSTVTAGTLGIGAVLAWVVGLEPGVEPGTGVRSRLWYAASCGLFALALCAKASVLGLPLIALAIALLVMRRPAAEALIRFAGWCLIAAPFVIAGRMAQPATTVEPVALIRRPLIALDAIGFYVGKLVVPWPFAMDYGRGPGAVSLGNASTLAFAGIALVLVVAAVWQLRRRPWISAAIVCFVAGIAPNLGLVPFAFQAYSTVADRYAYPAMIGVALAIAFAFRDARPRETRVVVAAVVAIFLAALAAVQTSFWRSSEALLAHGMAVNPRSTAAAATFAYVKVRQGDEATDPEQRAEDYAQADAYYQQTFAIAPGHPDANFNYGNLLLKLGHPDLAAGRYQIAFDNNERYLTDPLRLQLNWGVALVQIGKLDEAIAHFRDATKLNPNSAESWADLGAGLARAGQSAEARDAFERALAINPSMPQARAGLQRLETR